LKKYFRYIKKGFRNPKNILYKNPIYFVYSYLKLHTLINRLDKILPLKGIISDQGYFHTSVTKNTCELLNDLYLKYLKSNKELVLSKNLIPAFQEIFELINDPIREYLGDDAKLDGFAFLNTTKGDCNKNYSGNWHTDNVGVRIKMFLCLEGDGFQPTLILNKSKLKNNKLKTIITNFFYEIVRWFGFNNQIYLKNSSKLIHETCSLYLFDTNILHRGSYENAISSRLIFRAEFSVAKKHRYLKNVNIGTNKKNQFVFLNNFYQIKIFKSFLDDLRTFKGTKFSFYKNVK